MSTIAKEKQQKQQEKFQAILNAMLREEDNKYCADCDSKGPRWASWNLGVFLCIRCAGIHRNLGVHISRVKSVNLDQWTAEQVASMQAMGNSKAKAVYECNLPDNYRRSQTDSAMEQFIRGKYEARKWMSRDWVQPAINTADLILEDDSKSKSSSTSNNKIKIKTNSNLFNINQSPSSKASPKKEEKSQSSNLFSSTTNKDPVLLDFEFHNNNSNAQSVNTTSESKNEEIDFFKTTTTAHDSNNNSNTPNLFENFDGLTFENHSTQPKSQEILAPTSASTTLNPTNELEQINFNINLDMNKNNTKIDKQSILALYNNGIPRASSMQAFPSNPQNKMPFPNKQVGGGGLIQLDQTFLKPQPQQQQQHSNQFQNSFQNTNHINNLNSQLDQLNLFEKTSRTSPANTTNNMSFFGIQQQQQQSGVNLMFSNTPSNQTTNNSSLLFDDLMKPSSNQLLTSNNHQFHHAKSSSDVFPNIGSTLSNDIWQ